MPTPHWNATTNPWKLVMLCLLVQAGADSAELPVIHDYQLLQPTDPGTRIRAVAIDGNTIVLGAPYDSTYGVESGAAYVFERPPGGHWVQTARLPPSGGFEPCMRFGTRVEVQGTTIVANHWNDWHANTCIVPAPYRTAGVYVFERKSGAWVPMHTGYESSFNQGLDLAFDGTSAAIAHTSFGAFVMTREADGSWADSALHLFSNPGGPFDDPDPIGRSLDVHDGLLAISGTYTNSRREEPEYLASVMIHRRDASGRWRKVSNIISAEGANARVDVGPGQRIAIGTSIFEPINPENYARNASLVPPCRSYEHMDLEFDKKTAMAVVRSRPFVWWGFDSLLARGTQLHLYRRLSAGRWELVAQLIPGDNTAANVNSLYDYEESFAIDSDVVISNKRVWSTTAAKAPSYQFSTVDQCAGHRGNWIELTPQRWAINTSGGARAYSIATSNYVNQSGDRPGEYALFRSFHFDHDFDLSMKVRSNENLTTNQAADYVVIFGYQDESNYYYMMFSRYAINNELFKVVNGVRERIARAPRGSFVDNAWHKVDIQKRGSQITVQFDGRSYLTATDGTFESGALGIGSYNDAASFDDIVVREVQK